MRKQINYESDKHIKAAREAERNLMKALAHEQLLETRKQEIERLQDQLKQKDHEIDRLKNKNLEQERKFNDLLTQEKDHLRDEMLKKLREKSADNSVEEYKKQVMELNKKNEELLGKTEALLMAKDSLSKELNLADRNQNENALRIKELNLKYQTQLNDLEKQLKTSHYELYKKEALIAKITTENEFLSQENFKLKSAHNINDSILRLPDTCFIDIQSAKKQREAVHQATQKMIEEMAEEKVKGRRMRWPILFYGVGNGYWVFIGEIGVLVI